MSKKVEASTLPWFRQAPKVVGAVASTCAAGVSVFTFLYSFGLLGNADTRNAVGSLGVAWIGVHPLADTATSIGDTLHLAATITDRSGAVIVNARPVWSSERPDVAQVAPDGSVIAVSPGAAVITVALGSHVARARILVQQQVAAVEIADRAASGTMVLAEGEQHLMAVRARDARGHRIDHFSTEWRVEDGSVLAIDSTGTATGGLPGRTRVSARVQGVAAHVPVHVVAAPGKIELVADGIQAAEAGSPLPQSVAVRVTSRGGATIAGVPVRFRVVDGDGTVQPASVLTDEQGRARATWTLGPLPGRQTAMITADGVDTAVTVVADADASASTTRIVAITSEVRGTVGTMLPDTVAVQVTDTGGRLLRDVPVRWLALEGGVVPVAPRTDSLGVARAQWTLGRKSGRQRLQAQVATSRGMLALAPVLVNASAQPGPARRLVLASGDAQRGPAGAALKKSIVVRAVDSLGNAVADAAVLVRASAGAIPDTLFRTDSAGVAAIAWTLGERAGTHTLRVRLAATRDTVLVRATARPAAAANLAIEPQPAAGGRSRTTKQLVAVVTDVYGNPVAGANLRVSTRSGTAKPSRAVSDAKGRAMITWTPTGAARRELTVRVHDTDVQGSFAIDGEPAVRQAGSARKTGG